MFIALMGSNNAAAHLKALQRDVEELQNLQPSSAQAAITQNAANAAVRMVLRRCAAEKPWCSGMKNGTMASGLTMASRVMSGLRSIVGLRNKKDESKGRQRRRSMHRAKAEPIAGVYAKVVHERQSAARMAHWNSFQEQTHGSICRLQKSPICFVLPAWVAEPDTTPRGAVVVLQEIFG